MKAVGVVLMLCVAARFCGAAQFFEDFSTHSIGGAIEDPERKEFVLTKNTQPGMSATFMAPMLNPESRTYAFSAKWNTSVSGNFPDAGGEFSFCFGRTTAMEWGLRLSVITSGAAPGFYLKIGGETVVSKTFVPGAQWGTNSTKRPYFEVDWNYTNGFSLTVDAAPIFANVPTPNFSPQAGDRFVWLARNDDNGQTVVLDNIALVAGGNLERVEGSGFFASQRNTNFGPRKAFDNDNNEAFAVFEAQSGFVGANFSPARELIFYSVTSSLDAPDPHNWKLEGGPASGGPWTTLVSGDWNFTHRKETRTWPVTNAAAFSFLRFSFATNNSSIKEVYVGEVRPFTFIPVQPPHVVDLKFSGVNTVQLSFAVPTNSAFVAQASSDLVQWSDIITNSASEASWMVTDPKVTNAMRFYRLRL
jgi:hypothetical protein